MKLRTVFASLRNPANLFLLMGLVAGLFICIATPFGAGFDEENHLERVYDISQLHFLPNRYGQEKNQTLAPIEFFKLSLQRRFIQVPAGYLFVPDNFAIKIDRGQMAGIVTRSVYNPLLFLPQALVSGVFWLLLRLPVIPVTILMRVVGLLVYLAGGYVAIRFLPVGKWAMMVLALAPMALFQAGTINVDGATTAICFLFIALVINTIAQKDEKISSRRWGALAALTLGLGLAKVGAVVLLPLLLLLPPDRFPSRRAWIGLWVMAAAAVLIMFGWTAVSVTHSQFDTGGEASLSQQLKLILAHPGDFVWVYLKGTFLSIPKFFVDWVASYGYWSGSIPWPVMPLFVLALLTALFEKAPDWLTLKTRLSFLLLGLFAIGATIVLSYVYHYVPGDVTSLFSQGRYFIPFAPLFYLGLVGVIPVGGSVSRVSAWTALGLLVGSLVFFLYGLYATYYTYCDAYFFNGQACAQPAYRNLDPVATVDHTLDAGQSVAQSFTPMCGKIDQVSVLVKQAAAPLEVTLAAPDGRVILQQSVPAVDLPTGAFLDLPLGSQEKTSRGEYQLTLQAPQGQVVVGLADAHYYHDGWLTLNGVQQENADLIFRYRCPAP